MFFTASKPTIDFTLISDLQLAADVTRRVKLLHLP
jgi:hypothetical protein